MTHGLAATTGNNPKLSGEKLAKRRCHTEDAAGEGPCLHAADGSHLGAAVLAGISPAQNTNTAMESQPLLANLQMGDMSISPMLYVSPSEDARRLQMGGSHHRRVQSLHSDSLDDIGDCHAVHTLLDVGTDRDSDLGSKLVSLPSLPCPDDVDVQPASISPTENLTTLADRLIRMAKVLKLQHSAAQSKTKDLLMQALFTPESGPVALPLLQAKGRHGSWLSPSDKEGRKLDALGCRGYSSGAAGLRVVNLSAIMGLYNRLLWEKLVTFADDLPQDKQPLAKALIEEDTQARLEDLPFEGKELFSQENDDVLEKIQKYKLQMQMELEKNITRELDQATAELDAGSVRVTPVGSIDGSSKNLNMEQDQVSKATQQYLDVLKKNYMI
ncbi:UNVERIFIED_CONTAM: hypothetical protein K2H54_063063 [Gekko kuhli]